MGAVLLLAASLGLAAYGLLLTLPGFSSRSQLVRNVRPNPVGPVSRGRRSRRFRAVQAGLAGCALILVAAPWLLFGQTANWRAMAAYPALLWLSPELWIRLQARRRRALMARTYPDLLAHLVTQTRAGAGTLQAFATVPPVLREPLRSEVEDLIADLRVAPFPAALQRFADRCDIPEIRAFVRHVIYQQSLGIALPEVLAAEEEHVLAMAKQTIRQRIQQSAITMAAVTVILLLNGLMIYLTPMFYDMSRLISLR